MTTVALLLMIATGGQAQETVNWEDSVKVYVGQAREGKAEAYLKLADCYHQGQGVKHSTMMMIIMLMYHCMWNDGWAEEENVALSQFAKFIQEQAFDDFMMKMPEDDADRLYLTFIKQFSSGRTDGLLGLARRIEAKDAPLGKIVNAVLASYYGEKELAERYFKEAAEVGSEYIKMDQLDKAVNDSIASDSVLALSLSLAKDLPFAYIAAAKIYSLRGQTEEEMDCYRKAGQWACLSPKQARKLRQHYLQEAERLKRVYGIDSSR